jgi:hypothetical protein
MKAVVLASLIGVLLIGTSSEAQTPTAQGAKRGASKGSDPLLSKMISPTVSAPREVRL